MTASVAQRPGLAASGRVDATAALTVALSVFLVLRPSLDNIVTFQLGPNLNLPFGGLLLLATAGFIGHAAFADPSFRLPVVGVTALALAAIAVLSSLGSDDLVFSASMASRVLSVALVFVAAEELAYRRSTSVIPIVIATGIGLLLTAPVAVGQLLERIPRPVGDTPDDTRVPGPFPAPTVFATCMMIVVVLIIGLAPLWWRRQPNWIWVLGPVAVGSTYLLLANGSRSPLGALLIAVVLIAVAQRRWVLIVPFFVAGGLLLFADPSIAQRPLEIFERTDDELVPGAETDTFAWRVRIWEESLVLRDESPVIGIGMGGIEARNGNVPPHSTTVQSLVEMGVAGLVAHYVLVVTLAFALIRGLWRSRSTATICMLSVALGLCSGYFVMSFFENLLTQVVTSGPVAVITGLALGLARRESVDVA